MAGLAASYPRPKDEQDFERLCRRFFEKQWGHPVELFGRRGQRQDGVDFYAQTERGVIGGQAKLHDPPAVLTPADIKSTIEQARTFKQKLCRLVIASTSKRDTKAQDYALEVNAEHSRRSLFAIELWFWDQFEEVFRHDFELARELGVVPGLEAHIAAEVVQRVGEDLNRSSNEIADVKRLLEGLSQSGRESILNECPPDLISTSLPQRNDFFVGRNDLIEALAKQFGDAEVPLRISLSGPGGIGKTQVAVELALKCKVTNAEVYWIRAGNETQLNGDLLALAQSLGSLLPPNASPANIAREVDRLVAGRTRVLLVVDGADDFGLLTGKLPATCNLLFTSRNALPVLSGQKLASVQIPAFSKAESIAYLKLRAPGRSGSSEDGETLGQLHNVLGGFPLAVEQAAAYIETRAVAVVDYLDRFEKLKTDILRSQSAAQGRLAPEFDAHDSSKMQSDDWMNVSTTWQLNFDEVAQRNSLAADLMGCLAFFSNDELPREVAVQLVQVLVASPPSVKTAAEIDHELDSAVSTLSRFSLVRHDERKALSIHEVMGLVVREHMNGDVARGLCETALVGFERALPYAQETTWREFNRFVPHLLALLSRQQLSNSPRIDLAAEVMARFGSFLLDMEQYEQAATALTVSLQTLTASKPLNSTRVLTTLSNLGNAFRGMGQFAEAEKAFQTVMELLNKVKPIEGAAHAAMLNQLGTLKSRMGDHTAAKAMLERALQISRVDGDSVRIAIHAHNLAAEHEAFGDYSSAKQLLEEAFTRLQAAHALPPALANVLSSLANIEMALGNFDSALKMEADILKMLEQYWPAKHPAIGRRLNDFANALFTVSRHVEALEAGYRALSIRREAFAPGHHEIAQSEMNVGAMLVHLGRAAEAVPLIRASLKSVVGMFGDSHPETAEARNALGHALLELGRAEEAAVELENALATLEQHFPMGHRDTANVLHNLGSAYLGLRQLDKAHVTFSKCIALSKKIMPDNHPHLVASFHNRGHLQLGRGLLDLAEQDLMTAYQMSQKCAEHDRIGPLIHLGVLRYRQGRVAEGREFVRHAADLARKWLPESHRAFAEIAAAQAEMDLPSPSREQRRKHQGRRGKPKIRRLPNDP